MMSKRSVKSVVNLSTPLLTRKEKTTMSSRGIENKLRSEGKREKNSRMDKNRELREEKNSTAFLDPDHKIWERKPFDKEFSTK